MAVNGNFARFASATLAVAIVVLGGLALSGCGSDQKSADTTPRMKNRGNRAATTMPVVANKPSALAGDIMDDILAATDKEHTAGFREPTSQPASRPSKGDRVRFIRLKYNGSFNSWNVNMGRGFDYNLLLKFNEITDFKIAGNTEFIEIPRLARFRKGKAPPFVYMTGRGGITLTPIELRTLRNYCLVEGGMILADCAGGRFDRSFRSMCRRLFPDKQLIDVPDDDPLYNEPFKFPNGAPLLWERNKKRPQGIKHNGAWVVYYHPGNMGQAWKTGGPGANAALFDRACKLGVNIMYYTFTKYLEKHHPGPATRPSGEADR